MPERPTLHLMCGLPGAGKTTEARRLEAEFGAVRLTPDDWIHSFNQDHWSRKDIDGLRDPVEAVQKELAARLLSLGVSVILDWGCTEPPGPCTGDINADGVVDVQDMLEVILAWGNCFDV